MRLVAVCLVSVGSLIAQAAFARDWTASPAVVEIDTRETVYAIGDVHSDYDRLVKLLVAASLIQAPPDSPAKPRWIAGKSVLIFTGDMIDKGPSGPMTLDLIRGLELAARMSGGRVIALMGNHEAEFLADPTSGKSKEFRSQLANAQLKATEVATCRGEVGEWLCGLPFAARINDWFFCHAGNTGGRSVARLAADLQSGVDHDGFATRELLGDNSLLEARLGKNGPGGRPWIEAGGGHDARKVLVAEAGALGVAHIVEGHQPGKVVFTDGHTREAGEMFQWYGLLFLIDTGMSVGVGDSHGAVMRITSHEVSAICPSGKQTVIWDVRKHPVVGRAARCSGK